MTKDFRPPSEDENLLRMLKTPPKPHADMKVRKKKPSPTKRDSRKAKRPTDSA
jgi:hypothetical protein